MVPGVVSVTTTGGVSVVPGAVSVTVIPPMPAVAPAPSPVTTILDGDVPAVVVVAGGGVVEVAPDAAAFALATNAAFAEELKPNQFSLTSSPFES